MRFSSQYEQHKIPEWASKYIRYSFLLAVIKPFYTQEDLLNSVSSTFSGIKIPLMTMLTMNNSRASRIALMRINTMREGDFLEEEDTISAWVDLLKQDCDKAFRFVEDKFREFSTELEEIMEYVSKNLEEMDALLLLSDHQDPRVRISSLQRAIQCCHRNFWNLEVFLEVNVLAVKRLLGKLKKTDPLPEQIRVVVDLEKQITTSIRNISQVRKKIYGFAAEQITHMDIRHTKNFFRRAEITYNMSDIRTIAFCQGISLICLTVSIFAIAHMPSLDPMVPSFCVYRLIACFMFVLWVGSGVLYVFGYYEINWLSVFEIRRKTAITFIKLMMTASVWTALLSVLFMAHTIFMMRSEHYEAIVHKKTHSELLKPVVSFSSFLIFLGMWLLPLHIVHLKVRKETMYVLWNIFISPFGKVMFVHFFTGDVLTSLSKPIADIYRCFCFITSPAWLNNSPGGCGQDLYWVYALSTLPYIWRFLQCWNRFYITRQWFPHVVNAGKYSLGILSVTVSYFEPVIDPSGTKTPYVVIYLAATMYMLTWDTMMDFGFRRFFTAAGRKQKMYPNAIYYYVFFANIVLRCTWILTLMPKFWLVNNYLSVEVLLLFVSLLEILRRGQWTLLRVENEKFSNIEKYRHDDFVPKMPKIVLDD